MTPENHLAECFFRGSMMAMDAMLPATDEATLDRLTRVQGDLLKIGQAEIQTDHLIHGGMYVRTITLAPGQYVIGALVKVPTVVTVIGEARVFTGEWCEVKGYSVLPARAGRKQMFVAVSALIVSMSFPTDAKTVEEAEKAFTDEWELLLSHKQANTVRITGE